GTVPPPFADVDGDGFADVDAFGRFVDATGQAIDVLPPFATPELSVGDFDEYGRPAQPTYEYIDTSRTMTGAVMRSFLALVDGTAYGAPGDPEAWKQDHETMMYAMGGAYWQYGAREAAQYAAHSERILAASEACPNYCKTSGFAPDQNLQC